MTLEQKEFAQSLPFGTAQIGYADSEGPAADGNYVFI
jgi:hypothetical protein